MDRKLKTFWLYFRNEPIYAVRMPRTTHPKQVIEAAIEKHRLVPLCYPETPNAFEMKLKRATVER